MILLIVNMIFNKNLDCQILLKKYRFDYLLIKTSENTNSVRVVCYIEDFEIDFTQKTKLENVPQNINHDLSIKSKVEIVMGNYAKVYF